MGSHHHTVRTHLLRCPAPFPTFSHDPRRVGPHLGVVAPLPYNTMAKTMRCAIAASALLVCLLCASPVALAGECPLQGDTARLLGRWPDGVPSCSQMLRSAPPSSRPVLCQRLHRAN